MLKITEAGESPVIEAVNASLEFWAWNLSEGIVEEGSAWRLTQFAMQAALIHLPDTERSYLIADEIADMTLILTRDSELQEPFQTMLRISTGAESPELLPKLHRTLGSNYRICRHFAELIVKDTN